MQVQGTAFDATMYTNSELAKTIIEAAGDEFIETYRPVNERTDYIRIICNEDFVKDPTARLIDLMIDRYVGRAGRDDGARVFVVRQIPGFIEKASSLEYLREFANKRFQQNPNKTKILEVFEKSLGSQLFVTTLTKATQGCTKAKADQDNTMWRSAENNLRLALTIFRQSAKMEEFSIPKQFYME